MGGEKWGHIPHVRHTAHVPLTDVLVEGICPLEHVTVRRHAADGGREGEYSIRSRHMAVMRVRGTAKVG